MEQCVDADSDVMKQLPGRTRPRWQQQLISGLVVGLGFVVVAALLPIVLPIMLIAGLLAALALIPILRQLRSELDSAPPMSTSMIVPMTALNITTSPCAKSIN